MSPQLLRAEEEMALPPANFVSQNSLSLKERNYLGLSDCSSVDSSTICLPEDEKSNLNLKATELRLGLPGSQSPEGEPDICLLSTRTLDEKLLFPLFPSKEPVCSLSHKVVVSRNKRGFSDAMDEFLEVRGSVYADKNWMFNGAGSNSESPQSVEQGSYQSKSGIDVVLSARTAVAQPAAKNDASKRFQEDLSFSKNGTGQAGGSKNNSSLPAAKAQVVGWPPIRSYRKNTLATTSKNNDEVDGKPSPAPLFMKVSMEGAPYLRKVDLRSYTSYEQLSSALKKMFDCFTLGQCGSNGTPGREMLSEIKLKDLLHGSEYVLTCEDKDGDWMLVGDVPWEMFIDSCRKLKIMKSSDAIGLEPRAMEKSKNKT